MAPQKTVKINAILVLNNKQHDDIAKVGLAAKLIKQQISFNNGRGVLMFFILEMIG